MRRVCLGVFAAVTAFLFASVYSSSMLAPTAAHATPTLSGAIAVYPANADFSGVGKGVVGTPPANSDFETAGGPVGTPPANYDFATGDFSNWTLTGSPTIQSGGPDGYYAQLGSGQKIQSDAFTVASAAQTLSVSVASTSASAINFYVNILSGPTYSTVTQKYISTCAGTCNAWNAYSINIVPFQGQSIKVRVERNGYNINVDRVGTMTEGVASWTPADGTKSSVVSGGPTGNYVETSTTLTSPAFTLDTDAQNLQVNAKVVSGTGGYTVKLLSGAGYATSTTISSGSNGSWATQSGGTAGLIGQSVKLQIVPDAGTVAAIDSGGVSRNDVPGWTNFGTAALNVATDGGMSYLANPSDFQSGPMLLDGSGRSGSFYGNWFQITYRMKSNWITPSHINYGSTLFVAESTNHNNHLFSAQSKDPSTIYDPADVWLTKQFFVYNPASPFTRTPFSMSFYVRSIQGFSFNCNPVCEGRPDVASIIPIDGPSQTKVTGNAAVTRGLLPGVMASIPPDQSTTDPVSVTSGNYTQQHTDLALPGLGVPLAFTRTYSAQAPSSAIGAPSVLGAKWSHNWDASLAEVSSNYALIRLPAGGTESWFKVGGVFVPPAGIEGTLVKNSGGDWTMTTGDRLVYSFDSSGRWTSVADRNGNTTTLTYNGSGQVTTITDASGRALTLTYGTSGYGSGRITSVADGTGRSVDYTYDAGGDLVTITDVMGGTVSYQYAGHLLTQGTDAKSHVFVRNTYDSSTRVIEQLDADSGQTTIDYDTPGAGATRVTDQRGKQTTYYFDQQMRITDVVDDDGNTTSRAWDANNNLTSVTNALGKTWTYTYDSHHNVLTATDPLSKTTTYTYTAKNDIATVTDPLSHVTTYAYDTPGNLTSVTDANSKVTTFTVDAAGLVTQVTDPLSHATGFAYNAYGDRTTVTNALSKTWTYAYDSAGRVTSVTDPLSHATAYTYDDGNDVLTVTDPLSHVTTSTYDANGNVLTVTDANSKVTTYAYDSKDQLHTVTDAASGVMTYGYDAVGNLTTKQDPRGKTTTYAYDNVSRLQTETDPLSHVRTYAYDAAGRLTSRQDAKSQSTTYTYNDRDELTNIAYPDLSYVSFAYNDAGARTQMVDSTGTTAYSYDALFRLTGVTFPGSRTVSYGYDDAGRRTSVTYPGGSNQVTYAYDNANRLSTVTDWNSNQTAYTYDDANRMTTTTLPNGVVGTSSYDNANRLTGISYVKSATTLASVSYTVDAVGNRSDRTDAAGTQTYAYDDLYRLTSVTYPGPTTTSYVYDAFGNRTGMTVASATTNYSYDDASRLATVTPPSPASAISYTWDNNGDLAARGSDSFGWDYEDRMTSATVGAASFSYTYRGDGLRNTASDGTTNTTYTWDINAGLPVVLDDGAQYIYGNGLIAQVAGANTYYYLSDGLGSTLKTTDASGAVVNAYTYDVYGKTTSSTGSQPNDIQFAGQQTDPTGLQYLRARYYDPETGSFLSRDPLSAMPGWSGNPFGYAGGNPVRVTDPTGQCGYFGDPADPWCKAQESPDKNVSPEYRTPPDDSPSVLSTVAAWVATNLATALNTSGESQIDEARARMLWGSAFAEQFLACARDVGCSTAVSSVLHALGAVRVIGVVFEPLAAAWDFLSSSQQDLPGFYPPDHGGTPALIGGLVGESPC